MEFGPVSCSRRRASGEESPESRSVDNVAATSAPVAAYQSVLDVVGS
jgi:hypothetical protein